MKKVSTAIIGGGASGMFCAAALGGKDVLLLERGERLGRKLAATGNGQGNVTNVKAGETEYFSSDALSSARIGKWIARYGEKDMVRFLEELGGLFLPDARGRVYPAGRQASAVVDLLRYRIAEKGVSVRLGARVTALKKTPSGFLLAAETSEGEEEYAAERVVLCAGGKAAKHFGTDGTAYALARGFGHTVTPLYPSLVQLKTDTADTKGLKGIRINEADAGVYVGEKLAGQARGDVIFTDYGVSGDVVFRLSAFVADKIPCGKVSLRFDLLPDVSKDRLTELLIRKKEKFPELSQSELLCGILNNQVGRVVMKRCKGKDISAVVNEVKSFSLPVTGSLGFDYAQVTKGGIPLSETDDTLQSRLAEGLYFAGEILDADGECGGYNLQWAYTSARVVAAAIDAAEEKRKNV